MRTEEKIQIAVSKYIKIQYPEIYFMSDSSGLRLPMGLAVKAKKQRSKHAQLDLVILEPKGGFHGLIIELKKDKEEVYTKKGEFRNTEHVKEQNESIEHLMLKGYFCCYAFSFDECIELIDNYLKLD